MAWNPKIVLTRFVEPWPVTQLDENQDYEGLKTPHPEIRIKVISLELERHKINLISSRSSLKNQEEHKTSQKQISFWNFQSAIKTRNNPFIYLEQPSKNRKSHNYSFKSNTNINITSPTNFRPLGLLEAASNDKMTKFNVFHVPRQDQVHSPI